MHLKAKEIRQQAPDRGIYCLNRKMLKLSTAYWTNPHGYPILLDL